jgi:hypothetical protein
LGPNVNRCANPDCRAVIEPRPTGRPARYCGAACRQAAHRGRVRAAEDAAERAARLAGAKATVARLRRPLEEAGFRTVADHAANVYASAADPGLDVADLDQSLAQLRLAVEELAVLARDYRHAADAAAWLSGTPQRASQ